MRGDVRLWNELDIFSLKKNDPQSKRENTWHDTSTSISLVSVCCQIKLLLVSMIQNKIDLDISLFLIEDVEMYVRNVNVGMFALL